jgi:hypothetical protein
MGLRLIALVVMLAALLYIIGTPAEQIRHK